MYQKILVPLDGSELAECVLPHVEAIAEGCNVQNVMFVRVVEPVNIPDSGEYKGNQPGTSYNPGTLSYNTLYYWRIDAMSAGGTTTGPVWYFTTIEEPPCISGSIIYNTETGKFNFCEDGIWVEK